MCLRHTFNPCGAVNSLLMIFYIYASILFCAWLFFFFFFFHFPRFYVSLFLDCRFSLVDGKVIYIWNGIILDLSMNCVFASFSFRLSCFRFLLSLLFCLFRSSIPWWIFKLSKIYVWMCQPKKFGFNHLRTLYACNCIWVKIRSFFGAYMVHALTYDYTN